MSQYLSPMGKTFGRYTNLASASLRVRSQYWLWGSMQLWARFSPMSPWHGIYYLFGGTFTHEILDMALLDYLGSVMVCCARSYSLHRDGNRCALQSMILIAFYHREYSERSQQRDRNLLLHFWTYRQCTTPSFIPREDCQLGGATLIAHIGHLAMLHDSHYLSYSETRRYFCRDACVSQSCRGCL